MAGRVQRVLDTSALMSGRAFEGKLVTTKDVLRELRRHKAMTPQLEAFLAVKVRIASPTPESVAAVRSQAGITGDAQRVSGTDAGLVALAVDFDAILVTDDYSMQNLAEALGVAFEPVVERGITRQVRWRYRCTGCGKRYEEWKDPCPVCGAKLRTTPTSSRPVR